MGKTVEKVIVKSFVDIALHSKGLLKEGEIRMVEVEAVVDTGAAYLCLPPAVIEQLGLLYSHPRKVNCKWQGGAPYIFSCQYYY